MRNAVIWNILLNCSLALCLASVASAQEEAASKPSSKKTDKPVIIDLDEAPVIFAEADDDAALSPAKTATDDLQLSIPPPPAPAAGQSISEEDLLLPDHLPSAESEYMEYIQSLPEPFSPQPMFAEAVPYDPTLVEEKASIFSHVFEFIPEVIELPHEHMAHLFEKLLHTEHVVPHTELDSYPIGLQPIPPRPPLLIETNEKFLAPGWLNQGIVTPFGAIWRPSFWVFGQYRAGYNYWDNHVGNRISEAVHRLDLFGRLNLSGTERLLIGMRPLDQEVDSRRREFNSYDFRTGDRIDGWNAEFQTLFFEGDFGEIFPQLDPYDSKQLDYGFSVGRMPLLAQQGLLINEDKIDAVTVTRNTLYLPGVTNIRITGVYAWDEINRNNNVADDDAQMFALLTESDTAFSTINADIAYVKSSMQNGDLLAFGISGIQRIHMPHRTYNTSLHLLASFPGEEESAVAGQGELLFSQFSWTPHHSQDLIYLNTFWAIDQFTAPARGTLAGGPLGQTGLLFSAPGLGRFGTPLSNQASDTAGASLGYQLFFDDTRQQLVIEIGGRQDTQGRAQGMLAGGLRYQCAIGQHWIFIFDQTLAKQEGLGLTPGTRVEFLAKF